MYIVLEPRLLVLSCCPTMQSESCGSFVAPLLAPLHLAGRSAVNDKGKAIFVVDGKRGTRICPHAVAGRSRMGEESPRADTRKSARAHETVHDDFRFSDSPPLYASRS